MNYGEKIIALRKKKGITQAELGAELNVTYQAVSKWERGESQPDFGTMSKIAHLFEVPLSYFEENETEVETVEEVVDTEAHAENKTLIGVCHDCGKALYDEEEVAKTTPHIICKNCNQKRINQENLRKAEEERKRQEEQKERIRAHNQRLADIARYRAKGFIWGGIVAGLALIIGIVNIVSATPEDLLSFIIGTVVLVPVVFLWMTQIVWGGAVRSCAGGGSSIIGTPGVIFDLDLDGVLFLIGVKLLFAILRLLIWLVTSLICVIASMVIAPFTFVPALLRINSGDIDD